MSAHLDPALRHDIVLLFDVSDGNPNGDPDAGNQPRIDDETGQGLVTDVALKRKIRDVVPEIKPADPRFGIFVEAGHALNDRIAEAATAQPTGSIQDKQRWLCERYFDIRMFGAVLSTGQKDEGKKTAGAGQIRGPWQLTFARSLHPIQPIDHTITRVTQTRRSDIDKGESTEIGSKWTVPYGLYRGHAFYSASRGLKTGVTSDDLQTLWTALAMMFDHDRSASRGEMTLCGLYVFTHDNAFGRAPSASLTQRIRLQLTDPDKPARHRGDYTRRIDDADLPEGVTLWRGTDLWV
ncbi:type I-C CRISPR-associated protein Cas7/Csd2 [Acrocarpospora catenulata]|uniref:type I-C CRISPR-associated protein Cas7/Csd2 n=1 Tax=Acrocarpospora catenulata TaxID=2836182 RepID=UPI001BDAB6D8|nr:type I-C CRISPR-associated protein Cas7/Csd2 [Acrocarpospora catenulata]